MTDHTEGGLCEDLGEDIYLQAKETDRPEGKTTLQVSHFDPASKTVVYTVSLWYLLQQPGPTNTAHNHTTSLETRILKPADSHVTARERGFPRPSSLEVYLRVRLTVSVLPHGSPDPEVDS